MTGRHTNRSPKLALAAGATAVVLAVGGGVAYAATGQPGAAKPVPSATGGPGASTAAAARHHHRGRLELRRLAGRAVHGTVVLHGRKGDRTVDFQRGTVSAVTPASGATGEIVTVVSVDHFTHRYTVTSKTRVRAGGGRVAASRLKVADVVTIVASPVAGVDDALAIRIAPAA